MKCHTGGGEGVKKWANLRYVINEWPLRCYAGKGDGQILFKVALRNLWKGKKIFLQKVLITKMNPCIRGKRGIPISLLFCWTPPLREHSVKHLEI